MDKPVVVSVRLPGAALRKLQLLAQVYERSVGELIRAAVLKHADELIRAEDFESKALSLKRRNDETLNELLGNADPGIHGPIVRPFLRHHARTAARSETSHDLVDRQAEMALLAVDIAPSTAKADIGAAASHRARVGSQTAHASFTLKWRQGSQEWSMDGRSRGEVSEVVLTSSPKAPTAPSFVSWKNSKTGEVEQFRVTASADNQYLVDILLSKARKRAETVRDTGDVAKQVEALPVVHLE